MISNFDVEKITNHYNINVIIAMKDELKHIKPISGNYIISLESSDMGNGTHWMALKIEDVHCVYFDSYGYLPPEEVITFCKRIKKSCLAYNTPEIQDLSAETSGFFAIGFFLFLHIDTQDCLFKRSSCFSNLFPIDTISPYQMNHNAENLHVSFPNGLTMNILLQKTKNKMENSFLSYSARDNNC